MFSVINAIVYFYCSQSAYDVDELLQISSTTKLILCRLLMKKDQNWHIISSNIEDKKNTRLFLFQDKKYH